MHFLPVFIASFLGFATASPVPSNPGPDTDDYSIIVGYQYQNQSTVLFDVLADGTKQPHLSEGPVQSIYISTSGKNNFPVWDVSECTLYNKEGEYVAAFAAVEPGSFELHNPSVVATLQCFVGTKCTTCTDN